MFDRRNYLSEARIWQAIKINKSFCPPNVILRPNMGRTPFSNVSKIRDNGSKWLAECMIQRVWEPNQAAILQFSMYRLLWYRTLSTMRRLIIDEINMRRILSAPLWDQPSRHKYDCCWLECPCAVLSILEGPSCSSRLVDDGKNDNNSPVLLHLRNIIAYLPGSSSPALERRQPGHPAQGCRRFGASRRQYQWLATSSPHSSPYPSQTPLQWQQSFL